MDHGTGVPSNPTLNPSMENTNESTSGFEDCETTSMMNGSVSGLSAVGQGDVEGVAGSVYDLDKVGEVRILDPHSHDSMKACRQTSDSGVKNVFPLYTSNLLSYLSAHWFTWFAIKIHKQKEVLEGDVWPTHDDDSLKTNGDKFELLWTQEVDQRGKDGASLVRVIWRSIKYKALLTTFVNLLSLAFGILLPTVCVRGMLSYIEGQDDRLWFGLMFVLAALVSEVLHRVLFAASWIISNHYGIRVKAGLMDLIFRKILKMHTLRDKSTGKVINIFMSDLGRVFEGCTTICAGVQAPVVSIAVISYCVVYLGPWSLIGAIIILAYYPYQYGLANVTVNLRRRGVLVTDHRIRCMTEILTHIRLIKLYCWEKSFAKIIAGIRSREFRFLQWAGMTQTMSSSVAPLVPVLAAVVIFVSHTLSGNDLNSTQPFVVLSVLFLVRPKMSVIPVLIRSLADSTVALKRIKDILVMPETPSIDIFPQPPDLDIAIEITNGTFAWDSADFKAANQKTGEKSKSTKVTSQRKNSLKLALVGSKKRNQSCSEMSACKDEELAMMAAETEESLVKVLFDIELKIPKGRLYGVCGSVGSGKSSLVSAVLGQIERVSGTVSLRGSVAYVPQQAWILNSTLRDNITFGLPFDDDQYNRVLDQCCLLPDIEMLPARDRTEIGERGINLSGGQKQRVSLARAIYSNHDNYLLDDPLSAVDAHVGQALFENCHKGALKDKTVLFITHQLQYLSQCDYVLHMKDGRIADHGTHDALMERGSDYATLINTYHAEQEEKRETEVPQKHEKDALKKDDDETQGDEGIDDARGEISANPSLKNSSDINLNEEGESAKRNDGEKKRRKKGQLIDKEEIDKGAVTSTTYLAYARAAGGYVCYILVLSTFMLPVGAAAFTNWWLSYWVSQGSGVHNVTTENGTTAATSDRLNDNPAFSFYVTIYCVSAFCMIALLALRGFLFIWTSLRASSNLHNQVFSKVLESPMSFYDTTPVGRTLNRFSKDMDEIDVKLPQRSELFFNNICTIFVALVVISVVFPWMLLAVIPLTVLFVFVLRFYRVVLREIKRVDNVTRSPISTVLTTTLQGLNMVHAYNKQEYFRERFREACNKNNMMVLLFCICNRWLAMRMDVVTAVVMAMTGLLVVCTKGQIETAQAGLAISYATTLMGIVQFMLRTASETEAIFTSVERIRFYTESVDSEAPHIIPEKRPPSDWPTEGAIAFRSYSMCYRPGLPLVLQNIHCDINPQEKVGIVGRTGAGKSSIGVALFRLVEPASGHIEIDGLNICDVGLEDLRTKLSIIPQDPALFAGTLRYNLDPFDEHSDHDIWQAISQCHVTDKVTSLPRGLTSAVEENGENFSVGERQLICMARALLRNSKILILDEATAAIDTETDSKIQITIKEAFSHCTMLTIAHRINTVMDYDRILVMDGGKIVEFDKPHILQQDPTSYFHQLVVASELNSQPS